MIGKNVYSVASVLGTGESAPTLPQTRFGGDV